MDKITAVLFDKDGTLFDFHASWAGWAAAILSDLAAGDAGQAARLGQVIGFDIGTGRFAPDSLVIAGTPEQVAAQLLPELPGLSRGALVDRMNAAATRAPIRPVVPLGPLLARLAGRGLRLGVATNDAEAPARAHLRAAGVEGQFDFIAGSDTGHGAKPGAGQLRAFAAAVGQRPDSVLMVGDSRHDLMAGRAAGMVTVGVLTGPAGRADLADLADAVLPDIGHLPDWLRDR